MEIVSSTGVKISSPEIYPKIHFRYNGKTASLVFPAFKLFSEVTQDDYLDLDQFNAFNISIENSTFADNELVYIETQLTQCVLLHLKQKTYEFDTDRGNLKQLYGRYEAAALFNMGKFMGFEEQDEDGRQSFTLFSYDYKVNEYREESIEGIENMFLNSFVQDSQDSRDSEEVIYNKWLSMCGGIYSSIATSGEKGSLLLAPNALQIEWPTHDDNSLVIEEPETHEAYGTTTMIATEVTDQDNDLTFPIVAQCVKKQGKAPVLDVMIRDLPFRIMVDNKTHFTSLEKYEYRVYIFYISAYFVSYDDVEYWEKRKMLIFIKDKWPKLMIRFPDDRHVQSVLRYLRK